jgi:hypothetical protein
MGKCRGRKLFAVRLFLSVVSLCVLRPEASAQQASTAPQTLVRTAVANELASPFFTQSCTYEYDRYVSGAQETRFMIKSRELVVGKLVRINGAPVSREQEQREDQHLRELLSSSEKQERARREQQRFETETRALIEALPTAFRYTQTYIEAGPHGERLIHLSFEPATDFRPASAIMQVLRGMSGTMVVDEQRVRIIRLEARLFRDIEFGWGVLVNVRRGGTLVLERDPSDQTLSNIRRLALDVNGRILLVKRFDVHWSFGHFACFPGNVSLGWAIEMLTTTNFARLSPR